MACSKKTKSGTYYLHKRKGKNNQTLFFFSKNKTGAIKLPAKYKIIINNRTGLPLLKKK